MLRIVTEKPEKCIYMEAICFNMFNARHFTLVKSNITRNMKFWESLDDALPMLKSI
jgi:hypothetical protein